MTILQAIILGAVQGVSEFLPISSDGHLSLFQQFFGLQHDLLAFDVVLHFCTLLAMVVFFRRDILALRFKDLIVLAVGTIPAVIVGLLIKDAVEVLLGSTVFVAAALVLTGVGNLLAHRWFGNKTATVEAAEFHPRQVPLKHSFIIGVLQSVAILPGISRSGSTVAGAAMLGMSREQAFRFSFLLGLPAIFGASLLQGYELVTQGLGSLSITLLVAGGVTASVVGFLSLGLFARVMRSGKLHWFGWYCVVLGTGLLFFTQV